MTLVPSATSCSCASSRARHSSAESCAISASVGSTDCVDEGAVVGTASAKRATTTPKPAKNIQRGFMLYPVARVSQPVHYFAKQKHGLGNPCHKKSLLRPRQARALLADQLLQRLLRV